MPRRSNPRSWAAVHARLVAYNDDAKAPLQKAKKGAVTAPIPDKRSSDGPAYNDACVDQVKGDAGAAAKGSPAKGVGKNWWWAAPGV